MSNAAYTKKVQVSADGGTTWLDMPATSPSLDLGGEVLDDTELATNAGYRTRCLGLHDWSINADSNWKPVTGTQVDDDASGASALAAVRSAKLNRTALLGRYLPDGTVGNGFQGSVVVENFNMSGDVGGLETVSITLQGDGALADAS